jgi:ribosome-binding protein aMBF1 (putative translation factor)
MPAQTAPAKSRRRGPPKTRPEASILEEAMIRRRLKVNVRTCRKAAGLTLKMVAERADMHWRHWQKIEAGQVNATLHTLVRVAEALAVEPVDLVREPAPRKAGA